MKKALLVTHVSGFVPQFEMNHVRILQNMGYEIHYASNYDNPSYGVDNKRLDGTGIIRHQIDFVRSPYDRANWKAYKQLKMLMKHEKYDLVHCHNPMSGVLARVAARVTGTKPVIYTAHGFHFYKGAPIRNWLIYYTMEYLLSFYTDQQICINKEDYERAKACFHAKRVDYIPGVGVDVKRIANVEVDFKSKRKELGIPEGTTVILSAGELIKRKNHETMIRTIPRLGDCRILYLICGHGEQEIPLKQLANNLGVGNKVLFLGYREDIYEIYKSVDIFVFPSYQEGLPMALLEAIASGLPVVASDIRGNNELIDEDGGFLVKTEDTHAYEQAIRKLYADKPLRMAMSNYNRTKAEQYTVQSVADTMKSIYARLLEDGK